MKKTRKTRSRRPKPAAKKRSWAASLFFFTFGVVLTFLVLSFFPRLIPDKLQSSIRHSTILVKQWQQKYWPTRTTTSTIKPRQARPAKKVSPTAVKKSVSTSLYITLYKATPDYDALIHRSKLLKLPKEGKAQLARMIFAQLTRNGEKSKSPLPSGVRLRSVSFSGRRITLDLSKEIISGLANTGSSDEMLAVYGLVNTYLKNFPAYTEVQIMVDGHPVKTLSGHIEINKPLTFFPLG